MVAAADKLEAQLPLETLWVMPTQTDLNANHTYSFISPEKRLLVFAETNAIMDGFVTKVTPFYLEYVRWPYSTCKTG